jgi:hypothetical protein
MANDDFYIQAAQQRLNVIEAEKAACLADLQSHRLNGDADSAGDAVQRLANLESEKSNVVALVNQYAASQAPPPPLSQEERMAKPWDKMDYSDAYELAKSGSRFGIDDDAFRRGIAEVQKRRARGE